MASNYRDINGTDLDDIFELASTEAESIFANIIGDPVSGIDEPGGNQHPGFWLVEGIEANQFKTTGIELLKRYKHRSYGTGIPAATALGYKIRITTSYIANVNGTPTVIAGPNDYSIELNQAGMVAGTSATVPTYANYNTSQNATVVITDANTGQPSFEETKTYSMLVDMPAISSIAPVTYTLIGVSPSQQGPNDNYDDPIITNSALDSSGRYTGNIKFIVYGGLSGTAEYEVDITSKATNAVGDSLTRTHTFVFDVSYTASGSGGGP